MFCPHSTGGVCVNIGIDVDENQNRRPSLDDEGAYVVVFSFNMSKLLIIS